MGGRGASSSNSGNSKTGFQVNGKPMYLDKNTRNLKITKKEMATELANYTESGGYKIQNREYYINQRVKNMGWLTLFETLEKIKKGK